MARKPKREEDPKTVFGRNLARIVAEDARSEGEIGMALRLGETPGVAASNLRQYMRGERWPGAAKLGEFRAVLGAALAEFFEERS